MSIERRLAELIGELPGGTSEGVALGTGMADGYDVYESSIGDVAVVFNPEGVSLLTLADAGFEDYAVTTLHRPVLRAEAPREWGRFIPEAIEAGTPGKVPVDLRSVTAFQAEVLRKTATIPRGEVRPYSWVAKEVNRPRAVRAAGSAVARNPIPLIIPCHRVVRSDGHLGNYSLGDPHNKMELLEHEGAEPGRIEQLASRHVRVQGNVANHFFHHPSCVWVREASDVVDFRGVEDALDAGFMPCEVCRPV